MVIINLWREESLVSLIVYISSEPISQPGDLLVFNRMYFLLIASAYE